jgi:hypothetical protein
VDRLEGGTLRLPDLVLSGEGGFGFQDEARSGSVPGRAQQTTKAGEDLLERGASAGRDLLEKARGAVGK